MINDNLHICAICLSSADGTKFLTVLTVDDGRDPDCGIVRVLFLPVVKTPCHCVGSVMSYPLHVECIKMVPYLIKFMWRFTYATTRF